MTKLKGHKKNMQKKARPSLIKKQGQVDKIAAELKGAKTIALIDVRALPDRLLQKARKQLRGKAHFVIAKNTVLRRACEKAGISKDIIDRLTIPTALVATELSSYELFKHFKNTKAPVAAKPGQIAPFDIIVKEGETDLPPGPALSELKGAGINAQIKAGKIVVAKDSTVAKSGAKITDTVCKALQKLNVLPFTAGLTMVLGAEHGRIFSSDVLNIDEATLQAELTQAAGLAYNMSVNCSYPTEQNRVQLLSGSFAQAKALASESGAYSDSHMELLLASAIRMSEALSGKVGNAGQ